MDRKVLGIDVGSVSLSAALVNSRKEILKHFYVKHRGQIRHELEKLLNSIDLEEVSEVVSPSGHEWFTDVVTKKDHQTGIVRAANHFFPGVRTIIIVGAEKFYAIRLDEKGVYSGASYSTSCAAGTGSFLDQQANRLKLKDIRDLVRTAQQNKDPLPEIASRCAVFAKTDLIHAQQEGYSLSAICDSLTRGLARNLTDTLFGEESPVAPVCMVGGVAHNQAVIRHLEGILEVRIRTHELSHLFNVLGACFLAVERPAEKKLRGQFLNAKQILSHNVARKKYFYNPLELKLSDYPDFRREDSVRKMARRVSHPHPVEFTMYQDLPPGLTREVFLGIDIGSTSTKAALVSAEGKMISGFYTYTLGKPMQATQAIFEILSRESEKRKWKLHFCGVATTGSGRKFVGKIIGADAAIDEISTHARAAYELDPKVDTIIEIGGQDAKFTLVRNGHVTFSQMNSVCAAGTGSFIEEQATKLGVDLKEYAERAEGARSPMASDRCTVFMERDLNHYKNTGYSIPEILSAVLHSVRDNYLQKVAVESAIGSRIAFQGATARNKALVAAFEEKLKKKIVVSRYCHLTGAMGAALILRDEQKSASTFKGLDIFREKLAFKNEICSLCNNHCRISVTEIRGEKIAWGFLCGRDYDTAKYVDKNTSGFDLKRTRKRIDQKYKAVSRKEKEGIVIGIPAALHLAEETGFWRDFFTLMGLHTVVPPESHNSLKTGKRMAGAEFCAPMYAFHGQARWLADNSDFVFMPQYLESREGKPEKEDQYCYYTQYAPSVVFQAAESLKRKALTPLLNYNRGEDSVLRELHRLICALPVKKPPLLAEVERAYTRAREWQQKRQDLLRKTFRREFTRANDVSIVLIGRPYLIHAAELNKNIPEHFEALGIKTFSMDMLPDAPAGMPDDASSGVFPWYYASRIMSAASKIAHTKALYPVFLTAFKCTPDSFVLEYFKRYMDSRGKPYLILQVDEHDSSVGYETRIEAGIRSFRNHYQKRKTTIGPGKKVISEPIRNIRERKTILFPNWDDITCRFLTANLRRNGFDVRLLEMNEMSIRKSMATNTGQCIPLNILVQDYVDYIRKHNLNPAVVALWLVDSHLSCNFPMFPYYAKTLLEKYGDGLEEAEVYAGDFTHVEISVSTTYHAYFAYMFGGYLRRLGNHFRPRETNKGETDKALKQGIITLEKAFLGEGSFEDALKQIQDDFAGIKTREERFIPKVAVFGDFFVRDNDVMNRNLTKVIESAGGEVINTPYNEYVRLTSENALRRMYARGENLESIGFRALLQGIRFLEKRYYRYFEKFLGPETPIRPTVLEKNLPKFRVHPYHAGESYDNLLKIYYLLEKYPDIDLFVQVNPAFCCPSLITEAMKNTIEEKTGVPIVTLNYDGTADDPNHIVIPYLQAVIDNRGKRRNFSKKKSSGVQLTERVKLLDRKKIFPKFRSEKQHYEG